MASHLVRLRHEAYIAQAGRCFYCGAPMWESDSVSFAHSLSISPGIAKSLKATAEHLHARCDGGKDTRVNIVAACLCCNQRRHQRKAPPNPDDYREHVRDRLKRGGWHPKSLIARCRA